MKRKKISRGEIIGLDTLPAGQSGKILSVKGQSEVFLHRLWDMGITKGTNVKVMRAAPLGDPITVELRGYALCVRKEDVRDVRVEVTQ